MTITKKLLLIGACIMGIQYTNTYSNYTTIASYQDHSREANMSEILSFAQMIRHLNNKKALCLAQWLETQSIVQTRLSDQDITAITNVIINNRLTTQSKCNILTKVMEQQQACERKKNFSRAVEIGFAATVITGMVALIIAAVIHDIYNPRPRIIVQENPSVNLSYSSSSGWPVGYSPWSPIYYVYSTLNPPIIVT